MSKPMTAEQIELLETTEADQLKAIGKVAESMFDSLGSGLEVG